MSIKQRLNWRLQRLLCKLFGHKMYVEKFAQRGWDNRYTIYERKYCDRCGYVHNEIIKNGISRAQMLKDGWFIEK